MKRAWERELLLSCLDNNLSSFRNILSRDDVNNLDRPHWTWNRAPLQQAAWHGIDDAFIRILVEEAGIGINSFEVSGSGNGSNVFGGNFSAKATALHWAVFKDRTTTAKLLLDLGADLYLEGRYQHCSGTPLEWSRQMGRSEMTRLLEEHLATHKFVYILRSRREKERELKEALELRGKVGDLRSRLRKVKVEEFRLEEEFDAVEKKFAADKKLLRDEKQTLGKEILELKGQSGYRSASQTDAIKREIQEIFSLTTSLKNLVVSEANQELNSCPVCLEKAESVFSCLTCDNWVCGGCRERLVRCPSCREDFRVKRPRRNVGIERLLARL